MSRPFRASSPVAVVLIACLLFGVVRVASAAPPNADFTEGADVPAGWRLEGGQGRWVDRQFLEVTGDGKGSAHWRCDGVRFEPGKLYRFEFRARGSITGGCVISGPSFANRDFHQLSDDWKWYGFVFRAPDNVDGAILRIGQWEATGAVQFDAVRLTPAVAVPTQYDDLVPGTGESIRGGRYLFQGLFGGEGSNDHRPLTSATASFNSDRWCFGDGSQVTYRFQLPRHKLTAAQVSFEVNYRTHGTCDAEVSTDGRQWRTVATRQETGSAEATLPAEMFPAEAVWLRLRAASPSNFQVNRIQFEGTLDGPARDLVGETAYASLTGASPDLAFRRITLRQPSGASTGGPGGRRLALTVANTGKEPTRLRLTRKGSAAGAASAAGSIPVGEGELAPGKEASAEFSLPGDAPGLHRFAIEVAGETPSGQAASIGAELAYTIADFYRSDYGELLGPADGLGAVWWCDATRKVPRARPVPQTSSPAARLSAARNDREAVQMVVRAGEKPLTRLTATAGPLTGPDGATILAENIQVLRVYYHYVEHPTDSTGARDYWPDALPPLDEPLDVPAGENQPLWVSVSVPKDAKPGDYSGTIELKAEGWSAAAPLRLHVWNFALPDRNHLDTAFGLSPGEIFRYQKLKTDADKRRVLDLYFQSFADHRISPYDPAPLDPIRVKFLPEADPPRAEVDFSAFDPAMTQAVEKYRFTNFMLPLQGMGGGTFHERWEPKIGDFGESTPQYQAMFSSYLKQIEGHLREKGWLEMAYTYWFDEPDPKDYQFVRGGMERIKRHAPGLKNMLTEEPVEALAGPIDIWCPVSFNYDHPAAERRRAHGEQFWWYVCCGPKAPYCTLFIDHPATELRVWLWQTWQRKIRGILVWSSNYWTSSAAYPDAPQDPYQDPMGYVSGYSTPRGVKRFWGNGDGRFLYPPLAAASPATSGPEPVVQGPVSSIRWEMLREGIEDYEYLYLLRELLDRRRADLSADRVKQCEALLIVPEAITSSMTRFATDPAAIYAHRAAVAAAIEELVRP